MMTFFNRLFEWRTESAKRVEGMTLTAEIAKSVQRGHQPSADVYRLAAASLGLDRDEALMTMFGEKGRYRDPKR